MLVSTMRWFASLVVLCLLAGSGRPRAQVRAEVHDRPDAASTLAAAEGLVPLVSSRRGGAVTPEQRLTVFVVTPATPAPLPPARFALPALRTAITHHVLSAQRPHSARGPPRGGFVVESIRS